mmetsp:Transcript_5449/g.7283  ORF Transcript_5449/g.7283 Transcript_5449/m.7283 type:complete len:143 (-) Transcript_5449:95-523(-)
MTEESIDNIKMMVIVALIYEITLNFNNEHKPTVHAFFTEIVQSNTSLFTREKRDRFLRIDPLRISNFTNFKCDLESREILLKWYDRNYEQKKPESAAGASTSTTELVGSFPAEYERVLRTITSANSRSDTSRSPDTGSLSLS